MKYVIGVDVGGTNTRVALVNENLEMIKRVQFPTDSHDPDVTMKKIASTIETFDVPVEAIGISCPGPLDLINGIVLNTPNLHDGWWGYNIQENLSKYADVPVYLENDANLAGLAEAVLGDGKDKRYVQFLTVSTGLGSGQVVDKKIVIGSHGFAQEVANCILWEGGPQQGKLLPGSLESICSGTAITKRANDAGLNVAHAGEVNDLAKAGNEIAKQIMEDAKNYLANFLAIEIAITDPEIIILGGSVALKIDGFVEDVQERVKEKVFPTLKPYVDIRKSSLSEDSGLLGAAYLAKSKSEGANAESAE